MLFTEEIAGYEYLPNIFVVMSKELEGIIEGINTDGHLSLQTDKQILDALDKASNLILGKSGTLNLRLEDLDNKTALAGVSISNASTKFQSLSETQYMEKRVYTDDSDKLSVVSKSKSKTVPSKEEKEKKIVENFTRSFQLALKTVKNWEPSSKSLRPNDRHLPALIGSQEFLLKQDVGLGLLFPMADGTASVSETEVDISAVPPLDHPAVVPVNQLPLPLPPEENVKKPSADVISNQPPIKPSVIMKDNEKQPNWEQLIRAAVPAYQPPVFPPEPSTIVQSPLENSFSNARVLIFDDEVDENFRKLSIPQSPIREPSGVSDGNLVKDTSAISRSNSKVVKDDGASDNDDLFSPVPVNKTSVPVVKDVSKDLRADLEKMLGGKNKFHGNVAVRKPEEKEVRPTERSVLKASATSTNGKDAVFGSSPDDELFKSSKPITVVATGSSKDSLGSSVSSKTSETKSVASSVDARVQEKFKALFDDSDEEDLFVPVAKQKPTESVIKTCAPARKSEVNGDYTTKSVKAPSVTKPLSSDRINPVDTASKQGIVVSSTKSVVGRPADDVVNQSAKITGELNKKVATAIAVSKQTKSSLFDDSDSDDLFSSSSKSTKSVHPPNRVSSNQSVTKAIQKVSKEQSLFGDSDSDDDLFVTPASKPFNRKVGNQTTVTMPAESENNKVCAGQMGRKFEPRPSKLFEDSDSDDDLFGMKPPTKANSASKAVQDKPVAPEASVAGSVERDVLSPELAPLRITKPGVTPGSETLQALPGSADQISNVPLPVPASTPKAKTADMLVPRVTPRLAVQTTALSVKPESPSSGRSENSEVVAASESPVKPVKPPPQEQTAASRAQISPLAATISPEMRQEFPPGTMPEHSDIATPSRLSSAAVKTGVALKTSTLFDSESSDEDLFTPKGKTHSVDKSGTKPAEIAVSPLTSSGMILARQGETSESAKVVNSSSDEDLFSTKSKGDGCKKLQKRSENKPPRNFGKGENIADVVKNTNSGLENLSTRTDSKISVVSAGIGASANGTQTPDGSSVIQKGVVKTPREQSNYLFDSDSDDDIFLTKTKISSPIGRRDGSEVTAKDSASIGTSGISSPKVGGSSEAEFDPDTLAILEEKSDDQNLSSPIVGVTGSDNRISDLDSVKDSTSLISSPNSEGLLDLQTSANTSLFSHSPSTSSGTVDNSPLIDDKRALVISKENIQPAAGVPIGNVPESSRKDGVTTTRVSSDSFRANISSAPDISCLTAVTLYGRVPSTSPDSAECINKPGLELGTSGKQTLASDLVARQRSVSSGQEADIRNNLESECVSESLSSASADISAASSERASELPVLEWLDKHTSSVSDIEQSDTLTKDFPIAETVRESDTDHCDKSSNLENPENSYQSVSSVETSGEPVVNESDEPTKDLIGQLLKSNKGSDSSVSCEQSKKLNTAVVGAIEPDNTKTVFSALGDNRSLKPVGSLFESDSDDDIFRTDLNRRGSYPSEQQDLSDSDDLTSSMSSDVVSHNGEPKKIGKVDLSFLTKKPPTGEPAMEKKIGKLDSKLKPNLTNEITRSISLRLAGEKPVIKRKERPQSASDTDNENNAEVVEEHLVKPSQRKLALPPLPPVVPKKPESKIKRSQTFKEIRSENAEISEENLVKPGNFLKALEKNAVKKTSSASDLKSEFESVSVRQKAEEVKKQFRTTRSSSREFEKDFLKKVSDSGSENEEGTVNPKTFLKALERNSLQKAASSSDVASDLGKVSVRQKAAEIRSQVEARRSMVSESFQKDFLRKMSESGGSDVEISEESNVRPSKKNFLNMLEQNKSNFRRSVILSEEFGYQADEESNVKPSQRKFNPMVLKSSSMGMITSPESPGILSPTKKPPVGGVPLFVPVPSLLTPDDDYDDPYLDELVAKRVEPEPEPEPEPEQKQDSETQKALSLTRNRARIGVKRRPMSRKSRVEAARKSAIFGDHELPVPEEVLQTPENPPENTTNDQPSEVKSDVIKSESGLTKESGIVEPDSDDESDEDLFKTPIKATTPQDVPDSGSDSDGSDIFA